MAVSVKLDGALKSRVQHLATRQRRTSNWIMREAIQQYVEREETRESFRQEALASWAAHQQTGQHLTVDESRAWLQTWGQTPDADVPMCHE